MKQNSLFKHLGNDFTAGIVVFFVAVPLCLGIALASGAPLFSGMIAGIIGGIVVGCISNSQLSVSGPAAGLAAVVLASITKLGAFETFTLAVIIAGALQLLLAILRAGTIANYFPSNVIKGMLTAIGIIIILKQIPHAVGYDKDTEGDFTFLQTDGENTFSEIFQALAHIDLGAILIAAFSLIILILWENKNLKKYVKSIPGGLVAVVGSVILSELVFKNFTILSIRSEHLVNVPVAENLQDFWHFFTLPNFSQISNPQVWMVAATIAIVASIESLLCIEAIDKLDPQRRITNTNRELIAQGAGNIFSGLIGGLPITSVIVRSTANLNSQAKSKLSTIIHGALILICVIAIPTLLNKIPLAALASILLVTGYKLCNPKIFIDFFKRGKYQWIPFLVTVISIVFTDLLTGVFIGLVISAAAILIGNYKNSYVYHANEHEANEPILIHFSEEVSFLNKASIRQLFDDLPDNSTVILDANDTKYMDYDVIELIREFLDIIAPQNNIKVKIFGFKKEYGIENTDTVQTIKKEFPRFNNLLEKSLL